MIIQKFNYEEISRKDIDGKRHYLTPTGDAVPSVTTILDKTKSEESKQALFEWRNRVGEEKAQQITTEAASRGTRMHKWLENFVKLDDAGEPGTNPFSKHSYLMAQEIIEKGLSQVNEFWGVEVPIYYPEIYAGTTDCVGIWNGKPAIIDFKQSNKVKKREWIEDYFTQLCAYSEAHNKVHGTNINCGVILMAVKPEINDKGIVTSPPQYLEFVVEGVEWENYKQRWWDRVEDYHLNYAK
jgi:genome maintenance exonuclease 1